MQFAWVTSYRVGKPMRGYGPGFPMKLRFESNYARMRPRSRGAISPELFQFACASWNRGRRECRVRAAPAVSCAEIVHLGAHEHTGQRKHSDIPCAMALRLTSRSPRWSGLVVTVTPEKLASQELSASIAAPGPHAFAVRSRTIRLWTDRCVHRIPRPTCRDDGDTPL